MPSEKPMYPVRTTVEQQTAPVPVTPPEKPQTFLFFEDGSKRTLSVPSSLILGRKPTPQQTGDIALAVPDHTGTVSRNHARIELVDDQIWITDLASTNGTRVLDESGEETELEPNVRTRMHVGSRIGLGDMGCSIITSKSRRR